MAEKPVIVPVNLEVTDVDLSKIDINQVNKDMSQRLSGLKKSIEDVFSSVDTSKMSKSMTSALSSLKRDIKEVSKAQAKWNSEMEKAGTTSETFKKDSAELDRLQSKLTEVTEKMRLFENEDGTPLFNEMRNNPNRYDVSRLMRLLNDGIATERELILAKVMTETILETLKNTDIGADLPNIRKAIDDSQAECKDGYTDVFFFGVPSTGKTCVLMGMSRSNSLHINLASGGGDYAATLQQYTDVGLTVPRTPGTFVTTLEGTISTRNEPGTVHKVNLVEMSGEEFAFGIASHPDHVFTFEDMGSGATQLLNNNNRKVFFLIIDPTANVVRINREITDGYDEETGEPIIHLEYCVVNQRTILQKMVNLLENPGNSDIMKKVDSIHIIMTKSDTLGDPIEREEKALKIFNDKIGGDILEPLIELCREYNINSNTQFCPKLYTFSLGTFYVGGLYEYDQTDSDRLVRAIKNSTQRTKKKTFWDKLKEVVN